MSFLADFISIHANTINIYVLNCIVTEHFISLNTNEQEGERRDLLRILA